MTTQIENQTLALAGVFQSAYFVDQIAKSGTIDPDVLNSMVQTILNLEPESFEGVFGGRSSLMDGLKVLEQSLNKSGASLNREVLHYAMSIITVQNKLAKRDDLMSELSKGLDRAVSQQQYFDDFLHESVIASVATCYQNSVSQLSFRIRVTGNPTHLQNPKTAEKVRSILLFGVRSALLWRQAGGRRWQIMFSRQKLKHTANQLLDVA